MRGMNDISFGDFSSSSFFKKRLLGMSGGRILVVKAFRLISLLFVHHMYLTRL